MPINQILIFGVFVNLKEWADLQLASLPDSSRHKQYIGLLELLHDLKSHTDTHTHKQTHMDGWTDGHQCHTVSTKRKYTLLSSRVPLSWSKLGQASFWNKACSSLDQPNGACGTPPTFPLAHLDFEYLVCRKCILSFGGDCNPSVYTEQALADNNLKLWLIIAIVVILITHL